LESGKDTPNFLLGISLLKGFIVAGLSASAEQRQSELLFNVDLPSVALDCVSGLKERAVTMMRLRSKYFLNREEGVSLAEFALILPVFLALVLGMIDLGQGFNTYIGMLNATREGAIWLARNPDDLNGMNTRITKELSRMGLSPGDLTITRTPEKQSYESGDIVTVTLEYSYQLTFGLLTNIPTLTLHTEHTMRVQ